MGVMFDKLAQLPLQVDKYWLTPLEQSVSSDMVRHTTVVNLSGGGYNGVGEDVTYSDRDQLAFQDNGKTLNIVGSYTIASFSEKIGQLELFNQAPEQEAYYNYRRWAFESSALSLALQQSGTTLDKAIGRSLSPLNFVVSTRLDGAESIKPIKQLLSDHPTLRFKLDPTLKWSDELIKQLAELDVVDVLDLKGHYHGTIVDMPPSPELYRKIVETFPRAWIEDAMVSDDTKSILSPHADRLTWDAPIHSVNDIKNMPFSLPKMVNIKPSRFGSIKNLLEAYEFCESNNIGMYGGGQFELGPGRQQIQYLAALFHPDTPNDTAPAGYNKLPRPKDLPVSPLSINQF